MHGLREKRKIWSNFAAMERSKEGMKRSFGAGFEWLLAILGGAVLSLGWTPGWGWAAMGGWALWVEMLRRMAERGAKFWRVVGCFYSGAVVWNVLSVWWIQGATVGGMLGAVFALSAVMVLAFWGAEAVWRRLGGRLGRIFLVAVWLWFDYFFHNAEISWPWLTLGNAFSRQTWAVQWYEWMGALGGTAWVLVAALTLHWLVMGVVERVTKRKLAWRGVALTMVLGVPIAVSFVVAHVEERRAEGEPVEVVVIQPNIDPYSEKFSGMTAMEQVARIDSLVRAAITPATKLVLVPETALTRDIWEHEVAFDEQVEPFRALCREHGDLVVMVGASTLQGYMPGEARSKTARRGWRGEWWYDAYNSALRVDSSMRVDIYHKSKLVVGVEMLPYPDKLKFLSDLSIDLGGMVGSLGTQPERSVFSFDGGAVAPIICYESIFGEYVTEYVRRGATLLGVITNDGWWGDTPGYRQHFSYSRLRAIETRRYVARSANTGISGFISPRGQAIATLGWDQRGWLRATLHHRTEETFYVRYGDYFGRVGKFVSILIALVALTRWGQGWLDKKKAIPSRG